MYERYFFFSLLKSPDNSCREFEISEYMSITRRVAEQLSTDVLSATSFTRLSKTEWDMKEITGFWFTITGPITSSKIVGQTAESSGIRWPSPWRWGSGLLWATSRSSYPPCSCGCYGSVFSFFSRQDCGNCNGVPRFKRCQYKLW